VDGKVIELDQTPSGWSVRALDADVGQVALGFGRRVVMYVDGGAALDVFIERTLHLDSVGQVSRSVDPQLPSPELGELAVALLHQRLASCEASSEGDLRLRFEGGIAIDVAANPKFEAWNLDAPLFKLVSLPGGEVAHWDRTDPAVEVNLADL
jgi:hypothetical protein